ncbi:MAG: heavy metal translocating P-type ATPase [Lachnospiraceae bacterium]|nr:heavy metal translocating P-type ATPase [Lachnospiraceae bacterium]
MELKIKHEIRGRIRFSMPVRRYSTEQADMLQYYLMNVPGISKVSVYERTGDVVVFYTCPRQDVIRALKAFTPAMEQPEKQEEIRALVPEHTSRALNNAYKEKLIMQVVKHYTIRWLIPLPIRRIRAVVRALRFVRKALVSLFVHKRLEVSVLDAVAIVASMLTGDFVTASSVMFLLEVGDTLEEWTHKKSVADLAGTMSLGVDKVWLRNEGGDVLVPISQVKEEDLVSVRMGTVIPLDGVVESGEAMVNQASLTGEGIPVKKDPGAYVYAGTVVEEGDLVIRVQNATGNTRYEKIIHMIEESEQLKSGVESRAEHLADRLVPYSFAGTILTYLLTRNVTRAVSILMVDFSCALKLSMPLSVLSAMREAQTHHLTVKGGKFLEAVADADTLVFDKTGTLTKATPRVVEVVPFGGNDKDEMLRIAACLEEHYPHSIANAVVAAAREQGLEHDEMHREVQYVVAHGISSIIEEERVVIGSWHFVFEDEGCVIPEGEEGKFDSISKDHSRLFMAISGCLAAVICLEDPLREEAPDVIRRLHDIGFTNIVMMTGDSKHTARSVAEKVGVDEYFAEVLPEDKANYVRKLKEEGHKVIMIGDGINDSPALSEADAGIAISEGAQLAREIADITISENNLYNLITLRQISEGLMKRIRSNYRFVVSFNTGLILLGLMGILAPGTSALLHNGSTVALGLKSMTDLLPKEQKK